MILLRDRASDFNNLGIRRFGISRDSPWSHKAWHQVLGLDFHLLSDWSGEATNRFGVEHKFLGLENIPKRVVFLVGRDSKIVATWENKPAELPDLNAVLNAARSL